MWNIGREAVHLCFVHASLISGMVATWDTDMICMCMSGVLEEGDLITRTEYLKKEVCWLNGKIPGKSENGDMSELVGYCRRLGNWRSELKQCQQECWKTIFERELKSDKPCIQWYGTEVGIYKDKKYFLPSLKSQHLSTSYFAYTHSNTIESLEKGKKECKIPLFL